MRLFNNGTPVEFVIDDYIPCIEYEQGLLEPAFVQPRVKKNNTVDIWVHLIVKAWAKLCGCYFNMMRGKTEDFLTDLTGFNCEKITTKRSDILSFVYQQYQLGYLLMAIPSEDRQFTLGVEPGVLLSICRFVQVDLGKEGVANLVKLRNLAFNDDNVWNGKYATGSQLWTPELMASMDEYEVDINRNIDEECCFWVDETEFIDLFSHIIVNYNFHNNVYEFEKVRHVKENFSMVNFYTHSSSVGVISVRQFDSRRINGLKKTGLYQYS